MNWALLAVGATGGLLSGLFGVGGGFIMVPLLLWIGIDDRRASALSLIALIGPATVGSIAYGLQGDVIPLAAGILAVGALAGAPLGSALLRRVPLLLLRLLFVAALIAAAVRLLLVAPDRAGTLNTDPLTLLGLLALGLVMGVLAGLLGVGGGVVAVPALIAVFGVADLAAKGTSLLAMIPGAALGSWSNARAGLVRTRDALLVGGAAAVMAIPGVLLAYAVPAAVSGVLFGVLLLGIAVQLAVRAIRRRAR